MPTLRATYRLQLNQHFTFADAEALVPYLDDLGISHVYLSPILKAQPGSTHGYDTVDHTSINPELGTIDAFRSLVVALRKRDMCVILDFVPNHVGVGGAHNALWLDVLKNGPDSAYADWFDIDWQAARSGMEGKLLVPFLGDSYAATLTAGHLQLTADDGDFDVWAYGEHKLPIRPEDGTKLLERYGDEASAIAAHTGQPGEWATWAALDSLISTQHWRLAHFPVAADEINYRRFFINSELAGIRIDRPDVFEHTHALILSLADEGLVDGIRLDHIDGLLDPKGYLETLHERLPHSTYLVVEKILAPHEPLRSDWPVDGTTGYEVGTQLTRLLVQPGAEAEVTAAYRSFVGESVGPKEEAYRSKLRVMDNELAAELAALARMFAALAWSVASTGDLTVLGLRRALRETIAQLEVYRTYIDDAGMPPRDRREITRAVALARRSQPQIQPMTFDFVQALLCGTLSADYDPRAAAHAVGRFQQYTGPVMAKGLEDTALYRYNRLVALNEVGAHPDRFSLSIAAFHDSNRRRQSMYPRCMVATSTHDTKRGEDTRAVIASITDAPDEWTRAVEQWRSALEPASDAIHPNDLYLFFQLLLGGWPMHGDAGDIGERLKGAMTKSLREARERSDWAAIATDYEGTVVAFIDHALDDQAFLGNFHRTRTLLQAIGSRKALVQAALKFTIPGVPDVYRGAEDWEQSFVDPDNRRPVDFATLARRLAFPTSGRDDKLVLTRSLLGLRRRLPAVFAEGSYEPLDLGETIVAFRRRLEADEVMLMADLSRAHGAELPKIETDLLTVYGSTSGPIRVLASR
ncbi:MAG TPA: malto-oligosyltrehalose synthase [Devosia sp.]|jgi:(1->4)-alpha-D-glucan 1-alpha-D-glucosylmutase|nr:malto-oligosyltrehalose synthase [Devosia sp.]